MSRKIDSDPISNSPCLEHEFQSDEIQTVTAQWDRPRPTHLSQRRRFTQGNRHGDMHPQYFLLLRLPIHQQTHPGTTHVEGKGHSIVTFMTFKSSCFAKRFGSFVADRT